MKLDSNSLFSELARITKLHAYCTTGDERHLKDMPPVDFPKQKFCRDNGCACKDECTIECYARKEGF